MPRTLLALAALALLLASSLDDATAGSLPMGTIACAVAADGVTGLRISPPISVLTSYIRPIIKDTAYGACDGSGVIGGQGPIDSVEAKLLARLAVGSTCLDLVTAPDFTLAKLKLKWKGPNAIGRPRTIATSVAQLVDGAWDPVTESLTFTGVLFKGAFTGSAFTLRFTLDSPALLRGGCAPTTTVLYGADGASILTVP